MASVRVKGCGQLQWADAEMRCNSGVDDFSLPGYYVEELLGFGGSGEVWRARDSSTGELVALKRLRGGAAAALSTQELQREAALLATVRHDHIVALRSVVPTSDGLVLVLDYAEGGSLAAVLSVRGRLSAGEVVTIGAPLAQALSDIHARGLTHGDVTPGNVVFDGSGKPLLADLGLASLAGEGARPRGATPGYADPASSRSAGPSSDVHGLAAVCFSALAGTPPYTDSDATVASSLRPLAPGVPAALITAIEAALDANPAARPDAAAFGRALFAACSPVPVGLARASHPIVGSLGATTQLVPGLVRAVESAPDPDSPSAPHRRARRQLGRPVGRPVGRHRWSVRHRVLAGRVVAAACVVALLGAAVALGIVWGWADHGHRASASVVVAPATSPSALPVGVAASPAARAAASSTAASTGAASSATGAAAPDWTAVVGALDQRRDAAFADADADELDAIYVPGSAALAADRATLGRLVGAGQRVRGLRFLLESVHAVAQSSDAVTLTVVDTLAGYDVVDTRGVATHVPGRGVREWTVVLRPVVPAQPAGGEWRIAVVAAA